MKWYEVGEQKCLLGQLQRWGSFIRSAPHPSGPLHGKTASHWVTKWQSRQKALAQSALSPYLVTTSDGNFGASEHCRPSHPRAIHHYEEACLSRVLANTLQHTGAKAFTVSYVFSRGLQIPRMPPGQVRPKVRSGENDPLLLTSALEPCWTYHDGLGSILWMRQFLHTTITVEHYNFDLPIPPPHPSCCSHPYTSLYCS
jgi:hypothetical protein